MQLDRLSHLQEIFHDGLEHSGQARAEFLARACGGDQELRSDVEALLAFASEGTQSGLESVVGRVTEAILLNQKAEAKIGAYRMLRPISFGGMGAVYLAVRADGEYEQQVAIKLVRPDVSVDELLVRFRRERQILAQLNHPNIARLLDGGVTASGSPYLVMEFVDGIPIDEYCRRQKLSTRAILDLFRTTCVAVQYAHRNLLVHRDIKPSNILVTGEGVPKLLDFGIAKLLTPHETNGESGAPLTRPADRLMTLEYASPEQVRGEAVTTATDVYSLGALLYELLTRQRLFDFGKADALEAQRRICEDDPPRPSTLDPSIPHDLDSITMMALRKEPALRYPSADDLSRDLERFQKGYPVQANAGVWSYRASKFLRRNKAWVGAALLGVGLIVAWIVSVRSEQARTHERFNQVREMAESFLFKFDESLQGIVGVTKSRQLVVSEGLKYLQELSRAAAHDDGLAKEIAEAYGRIAAIQYRPGYPHLGDPSGASESLTRQAALLKPLARKHPDDVELGTKLGDCYAMLSQALVAVSNQDRLAREYLLRSTQLLETLSNQAPSNPSVLKALGNANMIAGVAALDHGDAPMALKRFRSALLARERSVALGPGDPDSQANVGWTHLWIGDVLGGSSSYQLGDFEGALHEYRIVESVGRELYKRNPNRVVAVRLTSAALSHRSETLARLHRNAEALATIEQWLPVDEEQVRRDPASLEAARDLNVSYGLIGKYNANLGRRDEAVQAYQEQVRLRTLLVQQHPDSLPLRIDLAVSETNFAENLVKLRKLRMAESYAQRAAAAWQDIVRRKPEIVRYRVYIAMADNLLGQARQAQGRCREALSAFQNGQNVITDVTLTKNISEAADLRSQINHGIAACSAVR